MRTSCLSVAFALAAMCVGDAASGAQKLFANNEVPVQLLPKYQHRSMAGMDTTIGRVWRENGPDIYYDIGFLAGEFARGHADDNRGTRLITVDSPATGDIAVAVDEKRHMLVVTVDHFANFTARNVRTPSDVVEVLLMASTVKRLR